jgi:tRNA G18 (ribose-2'-O)-methylase SpoU
VLACAFRPADRKLEDILPPREDRATPLTLVICPEVINTENMGALIRVSSAFGADAMIVGERSCDPYFRRSVRVSMGTIFRLPIVRSDDLLRDLYRLREEWGVTLAATVLDETATPLDRARRPGAVNPAVPDRLGLLFGSESQGLHQRWITACDQLIIIPMKLGTDSLNVSVAAAVCLYHFTRAAVASHC